MQYTHTVNPSYTIHTLIIYVYVYAILVCGTMTFILRVYLFFCSASAELSSE